jgi:hypothetical protein
MSYRLLFCSLVASATFSALAYGADTPPAAQSFEEEKAKHLARLQKELTCIEAATTFDEMHACRPPPPGGHMGPPPPRD